MAKSFESNHGVKRENQLQTESCPLSRLVLSTTVLASRPFFALAMTMSKLAVHDYCCCGFLCHCFKAAYANDGQEAFDDDAVGLSHVGEAAYECLRKQHNWYHHRLWNVTSGQVKAIDQTPHQAFKSGAAYIGHSDWFPKKLASMVAMTEIWCDVSSLGPPDGDFMTELNKALIILHEKNKKIVVRMMFGNIIGYVGKELVSVVFHCGLPLSLSACPSIVIQ